MRITGVLGSFVGLVLLASGCSGGSAQEGQAEVTGGASLPLEQDGECLVADSLVSHSCNHANAGPFVSVSAQPFPGTVFSNINNSHTAYGVALPGSGDTHQGAVLYRPAVYGQHAFFTAPATTLALYTSAGAPVPSAREGAIPPELCAALERVGVYTLDDAETYTVVFGPTSAATVQTIVEYIGEGGCDGCATVDLDASRSWSPPSNSIGEVTTPSPVTFEVPETVGILAGSACVGTVTFSFRLGAGPLVNCLYNARPSQADFQLWRCSGGVSAGDDVEADYFRLKVNPLAAIKGTIQVELEIEPETCGG